MGKAQNFLTAPRNVGTEKDIVRRPVSKQQLSFIYNLAGQKFKIESMIPSILRHMFMLP